MPSEASAVLSRRALLAGIGLGGLAAFLAACSPAPSPSGSPSPSAPPSESASPPSAPSASSSVPATTSPAPPITRDGLGGVILFDRDQLTGGTRNVASPAQVKALTRELRLAAGSNGLLIGVDQEGGGVTRLRPAPGLPA